MWSAAVSTIYYGFSCNRTLRAIHWALTTVVSLFCAGVTLDPKFELPEFRYQRTCLYVGLGVTSAFFVTHGVMVSGWDAQAERMSLRCMAWMATTNLLGAFIYAAKIPERWAPGLFDIYGASHQLFHMAVMIAAGFHYHGLSGASRLMRLKSDPCEGI
ncbi:hypothetical protein Purlil1_12983 [Purpureocillium lilacinum]|uniref:Adiponectin receptor protein 1 n=1 Tax=Purpureocillium lilacinum TaxID=33203 RepID=A0ABR0BFE2_PURLI|nr:hypothetical protein Purlil1_12983 [Purpureocillium lilacinum]